jgi:hypothetical protein
MTTISPLFGTTIASSEILSEFVVIPRCIKLKINNIFESRHLESRIINNIQLTLKRNLHNKLYLIENIKYNNRGDLQET